MAATGSSSPITRLTYEEAYDKSFDDLPRRVPDIGRIRALLGWQPRRTLDQIIADVIRGDDPVTSASEDNQPGRAGLR